MWGEKDESTVGNGMVGELRDTGKRAGERVSNSGTEWEASAQIVGRE